MTRLAPLPRTLATDRDAVQREVVHALSRARSQAVGRIGLVPTPGGIGTPAFGEDATVVRLTAIDLVVEQGGDADFSAGDDTPPVGEPDGPLGLDPETIAVLGAWHGFGWEVIDQVLAAGPASLDASRTQLWPEHFDVGTTVTIGSGDADRVNLGASPGDGFHADPYLYVGPWGPDRPGPTPTGTPRSAPSSATPTSRRPTTLWPRARPFSPPGWPTCPEPARPDSP